MDEQAHLIRVALTARSHLVLAISHSKRSGGSVIALPMASCLGLREAGSRHFARNFQIPFGLAGPFALGNRNFNSGVSRPRLWVLKTCSCHRCGAVAVIALLDFVSMCFELHFGGILERVLFAAPDVRVVGLLGAVVVPQR